MSNPAWMPLYIRDYLADTGELTTLEHGAYFLLIMHYWQKGGLPTEDAKLASITRLSLHRWLKIKPTIGKLFSSDFKQKRIEKELARAHAISLKRRAARMAFVGSNGGTNATHTQRKR